MSVPANCKLVGHPPLSTSPAFLLISRADSRDWLSRPDPGHLVSPCAEQADITASVRQDGMQRRAWRRRSGSWTSAAVSGCDPTMSHYDQDARWLCHVPCGEREVSAPQELSGRCDRGGAHDHADVERVQLNALANAAGLVGGDQGRAGVVERAMTMSPRLVRSRRASSSIAVGLTVGWSLRPQRASEPSDEAPG